MKFFVDTADIKQIEELLPTGLVDGVTTNPSLISKIGVDMSETIKSICSIVNGPVSAEVTATNYKEMLEEGLYLASLAKNVAESGVNSAVFTIVELPVAKEQATDLPNIAKG